MSIEAEIEETVSAFVAGLMDLVRETALETVRKALGNAPAASAASRPSLASRAGPAAPARSRAPASLGPRASRASFGARSAGPATVRSSQLSFLEPDGTARAKGRALPTLVPARGKPVASARAAAPPPPPVVVRRIPPRRRRETRAVPPPPPPIDLGPIEPVPAKNWVVVRRPARERKEEATTGALAAVAPAAVAEAPAKPRSLRKPPVATEGPVSVPPVTAVSSSGKAAVKPRSLRKPPVVDAGSSEASPVSMGETPKPPAQPVSMGETPIAPARPAPPSVRKPRAEEAQASGKVDAPSPPVPSVPSIKPRTVRKPAAGNDIPRSAQPEATAPGAKSRNLPT